MMRINPYAPSSTSTVIPRILLATRTKILAAYLVGQLLAYAFCRYQLSVDEVLARLGLGVSIVPAWILSHMLAAHASKQPRLQLLITALLLGLCVANVIAMPYIVDSVALQWFPVGD